jgi:hypothetical protein
MAVKVNREYQFKTDKITLNFIEGLAWELSIGEERIHLSQETFEELKAIMAEVLYGTAKNS